jgi:3-dehydrotetronate 4-kinase
MSGRIAIVADDNTGATDAAGMLTSYGARALLVLDPELTEAGARSPDYEVLVVSTRIRSVAPEEAYELTERILRSVQTGGFDKIQLKYCSTFDSTPEGNIGKSLDAARDVFDFRSTVVCPALPVNGRTTYMGYHFVHGRLLSESPLSRHPLNPMTDSDLVRWLGYQTQRGVGLIDLPTIRRGVEAIWAARRKHEAEDRPYLVCDALELRDIELTVQAFEDVSFVSGGSGVSQAIGAAAYPGGKERDFSARLKNLGEKLVVISGSESPTSHAQREYALRHGFADITLHPLDALNEWKAKRSVPAESPLIDDLVKRAGSDVQNGNSLIIALERERGGDVNTVNREAEAAGLSSVETGGILGEYLGRLAAGLLERHGIARLLVAGGETSGAVCQACGFQALEVGLQIDPGVPFCFPVDERMRSVESPLLVLKSGNFGEEDLYLRTQSLGRREGGAE